MSNAGGFGWLKGNSHSKRRGMYTPFMFLTSFWRPQGVSVSHGAQAQLTISNHLQRMDLGTIIYPGKNAIAPLTGCGQHTPISAP